MFGSAKPASFADCVGEELPYGWEQAYDPQTGVYYINHLKGTTQKQDPRIEWRAMQDHMIRQYLDSAKDDIGAKQAILRVKQERLCLAEGEMRSLGMTDDVRGEPDSSFGSQPSDSKSSLGSMSSVNSKYDPDLIRYEIQHIRDRVTRLKREKQMVHKEVMTKQKGMDILKGIELKLSQRQTSYTPAEVRALHDELACLKMNIQETEAEKKTLLLELLRMREELSSRISRESSPDVSLLDMQERLNIASQTDLSGDAANAGVRFAELARIRLAYDEMKKKLTKLQTDLADLDDQIGPGQFELDQDQFLLIREKEQLLRELIAVSRGELKPDEKLKVTQKMNDLRSDLQRVLQLSDGDLAQRLEVSERRAMLKLQITKTSRTLAAMESHVQSLSASVLSQSTSSLSTTSSHGSVGSLTGLCFPASCDVPINSVSGAAAMPFFPRAECSDRLTLRDLQHRLESLLNSTSVQDLHFAASDPTICSAQPQILPLNSASGSVVASKTYIPSSVPFDGIMSEPPSYLSVLQGGSVQCTVSSAGQSVPCLNVGDVLDYCSLNYSPSAPEIPQSCASSIHPCSHFSESIGRFGPTGVTPSDEMALVPSPGTKDQLGQPTDNLYLSHYHNNLLNCQARYLRDDIPFSGTETGNMAMGGTTLHPHVPPFTRFGSKIGTNRQFSGVVCSDMMTVDLSSQAFGATDVPSAFVSQNDSAIAAFSKQSSGLNLAFPSHNVMSVYSANLERGIIPHQPLTPFSNGIDPVVRESSVTSSGGTAQSVSAAISDESMTGDSGVYDTRPEAEHFFSGGATPDDDDIRSTDRRAFSSVASPQVLLTLCYVFAGNAGRHQLHDRTATINGGSEYADENSSESQHSPGLKISVEKARNLSHLKIPAGAKICFKGSLLPSTPEQRMTFCTRWSEELDKPIFQESFMLHISSMDLSAKSLQISALCLNVRTSKSDILASQMVSLADFNMHQMSKWYNLLSLQFLISSHEPSPGLDANSTGGASAYVPSSAGCAEPISDESTHPQASATITLQDQPIASNASVCVTIPASCQSVSAETKRGISSIGDARDTAIDPFFAEVTKRLSSTTSFVGAVSPHLSAAKSPNTNDRIREESSDESTVISSQTSTLTRNQGPESLDNAFEDGEFVSGSVSSNSPSEQSESCDQSEATITEPASASVTSIVIRGPDMALCRLTEEGGSEEDYANDDVRIDQAETVEILQDCLEKIEVCDVATNTELTESSPFHRRGSRRMAAPRPRLGTPAPETITESATTTSTAVTSAEPPECCNKDDVTCKLNRSDSDSSVPPYRRPPVLPFQRNTNSRLSLRVKAHHRHQEATAARGSRRGPSSHARSLGTPAAEPGAPHYRTSVEVEVDVQSAKLALEKQKEELEQLRILKANMEALKASKREASPGAVVPPSAAFDILDQLSAPQCQHQQSSSIDRQDARAMKLIRKSAHEVHKIRQANQKPSLAGLRKKVGSLLGSKQQTAILPSDASSVANEVQPKSSIPDPRLTGASQSPSLPTTMLPPQSPLSQTVNTVFLTVNNDLTDDEQKQSTMIDPVPASLTSVTVREPIVTKRLQGAQSTVVAVGLESDCSDDRKSTSSNEEITSL